MFIIDNSTDEIRGLANCCRTVNGESLLNMIRHCMSMKGIFQFSQILELPAIKEMQLSSNENEIKAYYTLELFTYGTLENYYAEPERYWDLTLLMLKKLRQLTILSLALADPIVTFDLLQKSLCADSHKDALIFLREAITDGAIQATINDRKSVVKFKSAFARDPPIQDPTVTSTLLESGVEHDTETD